MSLVNNGFKNDLAQLRFLEHYDELRSLSPPPDAVHDVATDFGTVRVYRHGLEHGVPVVLIHGFFMTSGMWWAQVGELAVDFVVYTLDMPGQPGASIQTKRLGTPAEAARIKARGEEQVAASRDAAQRALRNEVGGLSVQLAVPDEAIADLFGHLLHDLGVF